MVLSHSGWRYAEVAAGETFLALKQGLQEAPWTLGGVPQVVRSHNAAALTPEIRRSHGRAQNESYAARNRLVQRKLEQEGPQLQPVRLSPVPEYSNFRARVLHLRTIQAAGWAYTVPSRPFRKEVAVRPYAEEVDVYHKDALVERMERAHYDREARVDYRYTIGFLARKPGPFARYRFREQRFPTVAVRVSYDVPRQWRGERADVEYGGILHLATRGSGSPAPSRPGHATSSEWSGHGSPGWTRCWPGRLPWPLPPSLHEPAGAVANPTAPYYAGINSSLARRRGCRSRSPSWRRRATT